MEFKQELHGIPMYRILHTIKQLDSPNLQGKRKYATTTRISKIIGKYPAYVTDRLNEYWAKSLVVKKPIKKARRQYLKADGCTFHYRLTKTGERRLQRLMERFGDISQYLPNTPKN